ncbi:MAG: hypothetical protein ACK8QZ_00420, partial [Anaerolineales bacterium]
WRGIGCLLLLIMPLLAWGIGELLFQFAQQRWNLPYEWTLPPQWPTWMWQISFLAPYLSYTQRWSYFLARLIFWGTTLIVLWGGIVLLYAFLYKYLAPPDPLRDLVPPPKVKRYRR